MTRLTSLQESSAGADAAAARAAANAASAPGSSDGPSLTLSVPVLGVTATFSPKSLQALSDLGDLAVAGAGMVADAGELVGQAISQVGDGAEAVLDGLADVGGKAVDIAGNVVAYGVLAALTGGAVLDELV